MSFSRATSARQSYPPPPRGISGSVRGPSPIVGILYLGVLLDDEVASASIDHSLFVELVAGRYEEEQWVLTDCAERRVGPLQVPAFRA